MIKKTYLHSIILFWTLWWTVAFLTDFLGLLNQFHILHSDWGAKAANFNTLVDSLKIFHAPHWLSIFFYTGIVIWLLISMIFFWLAYLFLLIKSHHISQLINWAFLISMGLWLAFFLADNTIIDFGLEENHMVQGGFELLSWISLFILFQENKPKETKN